MPAVKLCSGGACGPDGQDYVEDMTKFASARAWPVLLLSVAVIFSACRTSPKVDWNTRVGSYTYDQAVAELGPPDKTAKLTDGRMVADWVTGTRPRSGFSIGTGVYGRHSGVSVGQSIGGGARARVLRLTFDPENVLIHWARS